MTTRARGPNDGAPEPRPIRGRPGHFDHTALIRNGAVADAFLDPGGAIDRESVVTISIVDRVSRRNGGAGA